MSSPRKNFNPAKTLIQIFVMVILAGTFILLMPGMCRDKIGLIDALFTATSAVCVTGLTVKDTGVFFAVPGQIVILVLIQIGALGYMSLASLLVILLKKGINIKGRLLVEQQMTGSKRLKLSTFVFRVVALTLAAELFGTVILSWRMHAMFGSTGKAVYFGLFHAVSAFCNAGFDIFGNGVSLTPMRNDTIAVLIFSLMIISGGIGYIVINDIYEYLRRRIKGERYKLSVHTKIVFGMTAVLLAAGTAAYFFAEFNNPDTLGGMSGPRKLLMAFFQSVTPRTAGFNMINTSGLINFSIIFTIILMFIGASPGGTGGGIKTTTFAVLLATIKSIIKDKRDIVMFRKTVSFGSIKNSVAIFTMGVVFIAAVTLTMTLFEHSSLKDILFEVTSAFGTVGLSTGITSSLTPVSKLLVIITMFLGRLGPLTVGSVMLKKAGASTYRYPEQKVAVG